MAKSINNVGQRGQPIFCLFQWKKIERKVKQGGLVWNIQIPLVFHKSWSIILIAILFMTGTAVGYNLMIKCD